MHDRWTGPRAQAQSPAREERIPAFDPSAPGRVARCLGRHLAELGTQHPAQLAVICIGTDRSTGDALGPLVGSVLTDWGLCEGEGVAGTPGAWEGARHRVAVYGTLDRPVHAANLEEALSRATCAEGRSLVVAVDACLGRLDNVGSVAVGRGPLRPGAGVNKSLTPVGDVYITGTVNVGGFMEYLVLQNTRLNLVIRMAQVIAAGVMGGLETCRMVPQAAPGGPPHAWGRLAAACRGGLEPSGPA